MYDITNKMTCTTSKNLEQPAFGPAVIFFSMLNSTEHEISTAHKNKNDKYRYFCLLNSQMLYISC